MDRLGLWLKEVRAPFLSLSVVLVFLGTSIAVAEGAFDPWRALLALIGLVALHISVNVLNEYSDFEKTGIDLYTSPTPFSGGSGMLVAGKIAPARAYAVGVGFLALGAGIGVYFLWLTNMWLLPLLLIGGFAVYFYTDFLARYALGEVFAGLGLGTLPVLGASFVQTEHYSVQAVAGAIPAGILTFNLLLINEFPDLEADTWGGRKNLLIAFGPLAGGKIYTMLLVFMYVWIIVAAFAGFIPVYCLAALATLAIAWKPMKWTWTGSANQEETVPALASNVVTNLATQSLLGAGFLAATYW
ncbi:MAG: prenyltransferase [Deltaproteobacteria bacterium]|jgi:1,4-dihydroxy-2-naphthoate octaprenyltransferase